MDDLRLVLLVLGVLVLAAIYGWEVYKRRRARAIEPPPWHQDLAGGAAEVGLEPLHAGEEEPDGAALERLRGLSALSARPVAGGDELVLAITVMARGEARLEGAAIHGALAAAGLEHGALGIYHRRAGAETRFSIANVVKPGTLDPADAGTLRTPGLALFLRLPGPRDPGAAFEEMLGAARALAAALDARLCDATRSTLTEQVLNHLREQIGEHERRRLLRP